MFRLKRMTRENVYAFEQRLQLLIQVAFMRMDMQFRKIFKNNAGSYTPKVLGPVCN